MTTTTDMLRRDIGRLQAVLCDPFGKACILGSLDDLREVDEALASLLTLADQMERAEPVAWLNTKHGMAATTEELLRKVGSVQAIKNSQSYLAGELAPLYPHPAPEVTRDAERYRWLRHGDNDEQVIKRSPVDKDFVYVLRMEKLDAAIDAAMAGEHRG